MGRSIAVSRFEGATRPGRRMAATGSPGPGAANRPGFSAGMGRIAGRAVEAATAALQVVEHQAGSEENCDPEDHTACRPGSREYALGSVMARKGTDNP